MSSTYLAEEPDVAFLASAEHVLALVANNLAAAAVLARFLAAGGDLRQQSVSRQGSVLGVGLGAVSRMCCSNRRRAACAQTAKAGRLAPRAPAPLGGRCTTHNQGPQTKLTWQLKPV